MQSGAQRDATRSGAGSCGEGQRRQPFRADLRALEMAVELLAESARAGEVEGHAAGTGGCAEEDAATGPAATRSRRSNNRTPPNPGYHCTKSDSLPLADIIAPPTGAPAVPSVPFIPSGGACSRAATASGMSGRTPLTGSTRQYAVIGQCRDHWGPASAPICSERLSPSD